MSDIMTWNWHGNAHGMPLGRNGSNQVVSLPIRFAQEIERIEPEVNEPETAPDAPEDTPTNPDGQGSYNP